VLDDVRLHLVVLECLVPFRELAEPFVSGQTQEMNAMRRESGNHLIADAPVAMSVTRRASPHRRDHVDLRLGVVFRAVRAVALGDECDPAPSGDQLGSPSFSPADVRRRGSPPNDERIHRLDRPLFSFMSYEVTETQICAPSGESVGCAGRSSFQRSSAVIGFRFIGGVVDVGAAFYVLGVKSAS
jgi:hypothetical protein